MNSENSRNPVTVIALNGDISVTTSEQFFYLANGYYEDSISICPKWRAEQQAFSDKILEMEIEEDRHIIRENNRDYNDE